MIKNLDVSTQSRYQLLDITSNIEDTVKESGVENGVIYISTHHSTTGILITENESGLVRDWMEFFKKQTAGIKFTHDAFENNGDSHVLAGLIGHEKTFIIEKSKMIIGKWQQIFLAEFDGPRIRQITIKIAKD
jgi:secondary thiamine-phosphate synthase enzyme